MRVSRMLAAVGLVACLACAAQASMITIDGGGFGATTGVQWVTVGPTVSGWKNGTQTINLAEGDYTMYLASPGTVSWSFSVAGDTVTTDNVHATASGSTLAFKTQQVQIDAPADYKWVLSQSGNWITGSTSDGFVPGSYDVYNAASQPIGTVNVPVDATGWTQTLTDGGNSITFSAVPEPATMSLLALGGMAMLRRRK